MEKIKKNKIAMICCITLLFAVGILYLQNRSLKWEMIYEKSVPDVELINYLSFDSRNIASGGLTGFVVFDNREKQPKAMRQYVQITASSDLNEGRQTFYLTDIIKMDVLAPRYFDPVVLTISNIEGNIVTLTDGNNNSYLINKSTSEVSIFDSTRDVTRLITEDSKFREFMRDFLK
jgi:hypothetical protein